MDASHSTPRLGQPSSSPSRTAQPAPHSPSVNQPPRTPYPRPDEYPQEKVELDSRRIPPASPSSIPPHSSRLPYPYSSSAASTSTYSRTTPACSRPRGLLIANLLKPWTPIILYAITTLGFLAAVSFWKAEVFEGTLATPALVSAAGLQIFPALDELSNWLKSDEYIGYASMFMLIFLTTFRE